MKSPMILGLMVVALVGSISANAQEKTGTVSQALGEQCSVIANYVPGSQGCGNSSMGDIQIDLQSQLQPFKNYSIVVEVINEADQVDTAYQENLVSYGYSTYQKSGIAYGITSWGKHQVNLKVINSDTGTQVCGAQQLVSAAQ